MATIPTQMGPISAPNTIEANGKCVLGNLVLKDRKTNTEWEIYIEDGVIYAEPWEKDERREHRIKKVLGE